MRQQVPAPQLAAYTPAHTPPPPESVPVTDKTYPLDEHMEYLQ